MTLGQAARALALVVLFCLIQVPRSVQQSIQRSPPLPQAESLSFPTIELRAARARYFKLEFHERQVRALARLDRVNRLLANLHASPETLRDVFGRAFIPGISEKQLDTTDGFSLLTPRPRNTAAGPDLAAHSAELIDLLRPEREPLPPWRDPKDATWRAVREISNELRQ